MKISENLYQLINVLTKAEKRYFRLQAEFHRTDSHLLQLFDAISQKAVHSDAELKDYFKSAGFIGQLDVLKVHLYQLILNSMRQFHGSRNKQRMVRAMVDDLHFLFDKALYSQCSKLLKKAKAAAAEIGYQSALIDLLDIERNLLGVDVHMAYTTQSIAAIDLAENGVIKNLQTEARFKHFGAMTGYLNKQQGLARTADALEQIQQMAADPLLQPEVATTLRSKRLLYYSLMAAELASGNYEQAGIYNQEILATYGDNRVLIRENPIGLLSAIGNQIVINIRLKKYATAIDLINALIELPTLLNKAQRRSKTLNKRIELHVLNYSMGIYLECGNIPEAIQLEPKILEFIRMNKTIIPVHRLLELHFSLLYLYFILGDYDKALKQLKLLEQFNLRQLKQDLFASVQLIKLLIHYELDNRNLLPYLIRSVYRSLSQSARLFEFEYVLIQFMRNELPKVTGGIATARAFNKLLLQLTKIQHDKYEQAAFIMFDIVAWLRSKIEHKPLLAVLSEIKSE